MSRRKHKLKHWHQIHAMIHATQAHVYENLHVHCIYYIPHVRMSDLVYQTLPSMTSRKAAWGSFELSQGYCDDLGIPCSFLPVVPAVGGLLPNLLPLFSSFFSSFCPYLNLLVRNKSRKGARLSWIQNLNKQKSKSHITTLYEMSGVSLSNPFICLKSHSKISILASRPIWTINPF